MMYLKKTRPLHLLWMPIAVAILSGCAEENQEDPQSVGAPAPTSKVRSVIPTGPIAEGNFPLEPDASTIEWAQNPKLPELPPVCHYVYSAGQTPFLAIGFLRPKYASESWNLATGMKVGEIMDMGRFTSNRSLSPDGKAVAVWIRESKSIEIWSYETGQKVAVIDIGSFAQFKLASRDRLIVSLTTKADGVKSYMLKLFDATNGKLKSERPPESDISKVLFLSNLRFSSNGKYMAYFRTDSGFYIYQTDTLKRVAKIPVEVIPKSSGGCAFSLDGTQLVGLSSDSAQTTVFVASLSDGSVSKFLLAGRLSSFLPGAENVPAIEWLPDQSGWILSGRSIVNAKMQRRVWTVDLGAERFRRNVVLQGCLIHPALERDPQTNVPKSVLQRYTWPQEAVTAAVPLIRSNENAIIRPGSAVRVVIESSPLELGNIEDAKRELSKTLNHRLIAAGLKPTNAEDADAELAVDYSEGPGRLMKRRGSLLSAVTTDSTNSTRSWSATIKLTIRKPGTDAILWSGDIVVDPAALSVPGRINDKSIRDAVFGKVPNELAAYPFPWFISKDIALPGLTSKKSPSP